MPISSCFRLALLSVCVAAVSAAAAVAQTNAAPPEAPVEDGLAFSKKTEMVDGPALQVVFGERAVFRLDGAAPVLESVEKGALSVAHPAGAVQESFAPPAAGQLAVALDGSPEKQASYLKIWNGLDHAVLYRAGVLAYVDGKLTPITVKVCAAPAGGTNVQTWPMPVAAVVVANFSAAPAPAACR